MPDTSARTIQPHGRRWRHVTSWHSEGTASSGTYGLNATKRARIGDLVVIAHSSRNVGIAISNGLDGFTRRYNYFEGETFGIAAKVWEQSDNDGDVQYELSGGGAGQSYIIGAHVFRPTTPVERVRFMGGHYSSRMYETAVREGALVCWMYSDINVSTNPALVPPFRQAWADVVNNGGYYVPMCLWYWEADKDQMSPTNGGTGTHKHYAAYGLVAE